MVNGEAAALQEAQVILHKASIVGGPAAEERLCHRRAAQVCE